MDWVWLLFSLMPVLIAVIALMTWGSVELYFLKGTRSTNLCGPNPLGKQQARPRSAASRLRATTAYDQTSEIETVPHIGFSPPSVRAHYCPVIEFGLLGQTMHQVDERASVADIEQLTRVYRGILERYFG
jgi:hypothetical protein